MKLAVKVVPGASRTEISGWLGEALKVRVSAPPERGRANEALVVLIADRLGLPTGAVRVAAGAGSPRKTIEIAGLSEQEVRDRLCKPKA